MIMNSLIISKLDTIVIGVIGGRWNWDFYYKRSTKNLRIPFK
jgi:heme/copper-type cytochrome/quinol oxidase subunit 2